MFQWFPNYLILIPNRNAKTFFVMTLVGLFFGQVYTAKEVPCESIRLEETNTTLTCFMTGKTIIDSEGYKISSVKDLTVAHLRFSGNRKISYLPERIDETFPKILSLVATNCSIKAIKRENFIGLKSLTTLWLIENQIERIYSDTFKDLESVRWIFLGE